MRRNDFQEQLQRSKNTAEIPIAKWFKQHGAFVIPLYRFSGAGAPKLEAFVSDDSSILPDLQVARAGMMFFVEVKLKTEATFTRMLQQYDTGFSIRHWENYRTHQERTGAKVFVSFAHEKENLVTLDGLDSLAVHSGRREDRGTKMERDGMVFWPLRELTVIAKLSDVRGGKAPDPMNPPSRRALTKEEFRGRAHAWYRRELGSEGTWVGPYKILMDTDGGFIARSAERTLGTFATENAAIFAAQNALTDHA